MSGVAWGDVPTYGLLIGAGWTAWYATRAYRQQVKANGLLQRQLADQRGLIVQQTEVLGLQAEDLRQSLAERAGQADRAVEAQARLVYVSQEHLGRDPRVPQATAYFDALKGVNRNPPPVVAVTLRNGSDQPVRDVAITWRATGVAQQKLGEEERPGQLLPGTEFTAYAEVPAAVSTEQVMVWVTFRDSEERTWLRKADTGELVRVD
jgi:hypothetical protein